MLKQRQITTPLVDPAGLPPVAIVPLKALGRLKTLNLVLRLVRFIFSIFRAQRIRREPPAAIAVRVRNFLEDTGGLWVKFGQLISLRIDLLPREMADELTQLQYHAYGFAPEIARQIVTETLGRPSSRYSTSSRTIPLQQPPSRKSTAPTSGVRMSGWW